MFTMDYKLTVTPDFIREAKRDIMDTIVEIEQADKVSLKADRRALNEVNWAGLSTETVMLKANLWKVKLLQDSLKRRAKS